MNRSCIVRAHSAGLFSNINKVVTCLELYDHVHVDWSNELNVYKPRDGQDENAWNHLFVQSPRPTEAFDEVLEYPHLKYTATNVAAQYKSGDEWRHRLNLLWRKLTPQHRVLANAMRFTWRTIGVIVRSDAIAGEQENGSNASLDQYVWAVKQVLREHKNKPLVFAVCSDEVSLRRFVKEFDALTYPASKRARSSKEDRHMEQPQTIMDAIHCMAEVISLSRCQALVHQVSNMATAALYMNPYMKSVYIQ